MVGALRGSVRTMAHTSPKDPQAITLAWWLSQLRPAIT